MFFFLEGFKNPVQDSCHKMRDELILFLHDFVHDTIFFFFFAIHTTEWIWFFSRLYGGSALVYIVLWDYSLAREWRARDRMYERNDDVVKGP